MSDKIISTRGLYSIVGPSDSEDECQTRFLCRGKELLCSVDVAVNEGAYENDRGYTVQIPPTILKWVDDVYYD